MSWARELLTELLTPAASREALLALLLRLAALAAA